MLASLIAERYSKALLRAAQAEKALAEVGVQAETLRRALAGAADAAAFLGDPLALPQEKLRVLTGVFKAGGHPLVRGFLAAVLEHKRERFLPAILGAFARLCDEAEGRVTASFGTARALASGERALLETALSRSLRRTVTLRPYTDKALLGGAVLTLGDTVFDGSLRSGLTRLGRLLNEGPPPQAPKAARGKAKGGAKAPAKKTGAAKGADKSGSLARPRKADQAGTKAVAKTEKKASSRKKAAPPKKAKGKP